MRCSECGSEVQEGARFCSFCGANLIQNEFSYIKEKATKRSLVNRIESKFGDCWNRLAAFYKISLISLLGIIMLFLIAYLTSKIFAIVCAVVQFVGVVVAMLLRRGIIKTSKKWLAYFVLSIAILLSALNIFSYSWNRAPMDTDNDDHPVVTTPEYVDSADDTKVTETTAPVSKTAFLPFSENECIGKKQEDVVNQLEQEGFNNISIEALAELEAEELDRKGEICEITVDGSEIFAKGAEFDKTIAIKITYYDAKNVAAPIAAKDGEEKDVDELANLFKEAGFVNVAVEIRNDIDPEYSEETLRNEISIASESSFEITDTFPIDAKVKITSHRPMEKYKVKINIDFIPNLFFNKYGVDVEIGYKELGTLSHGENDSYEVWCKPGKYTITFTKTGWLKPEKKVDITIKGETEITYQISCYEDSIHVEQTEFIDKGAVGEGEAMMPASASDFKYDNYKDVETALKDAGFTNIKTAVLYDIVLGWTSEGEVDSVSINGDTEFVKGDVFKKDAEIVITYHMWEDDDPSRIKMSKMATEYEGMHYSEVRKIFKDLGFTNVVLEETETTDTSYGDGEVYRITIDYEHFDVGDAYESDDKVLIKYYSVSLVVSEGTTTSSTVYYSSNDYETATKGNTGVFSYKNKSGSYDVYWIVDFDEGYVYFFTEGNGEDYCDKIKITSGTLNDRVTITWNLDGEKTNWYLHFKYANSPVTLIVNDHFGLATEFNATDLDNALALRDTKKIQNS